MSETHSNIKLVPMAAHHLTEVAAIEQSAFSDPWSANSFFEVLGLTDKCWVALDGERVVGYAVSQWVLDEIHLLNIAVDRSAQRNGVASKLLRLLIERGSQCGMADIYLEVRVSNTAAKTLYRKFGFYDLAVRKQYYRDGEDAQLMHYVLTPSDEQPDDSPATAADETVTTR